MSGWLRCIVDHTPELKSRHTFLCTENTQTIGFSLANYGLFLQTKHLCCTKHLLDGDRKKSRLLLKIKSKFKVIQIK